MAKENIGLIFCRGGSKGIPRKNIKLFHGKPLINWIAQSAIKSSVFHDLYLSTEDPEIAKIGEACGLTVPFLRPKELATDTSDQFLSHEHIINKLGLSDDRHRICILNNNPFIDETIIKTSFDKYMALDEMKIVIDAVPLSSDYKYFRQMANENGTLQLIFPEEYAGSNINRQSETEILSPINNVRWGKPSWMSSYSAYKNRVKNSGHGFVLLAKSQNFDLDDKEDWTIAERVFAKEND